MHSKFGSPSLRLVIAFALISFFLSAGPALGQNRIPNGRNPVPSAEYYFTYAKLDEGELGDALRAGADSLRGSPRGANGRYIDAICYHVVIGESFYKQGRYADALNQYHNALVQFLLWPNWPLKVDWKPLQQIQALQPVNIPWGKSSRQNVKFANMGETQMMNRGGLIPIPGGALQNAQKFPMNAMEIIRATAVAMQRYRELMGPACEFEPIVDQLDQTLATTFPPNHYSQCFADILRGLVARMNNADGQAYALFKRGMLMGGIYDHPLTGIALYEMGSISMERGDFAAAVEEFNESTFSQAYYLYPAGPTLLEQAFHNAYVCTQLSNRGMDYAPAAMAAKWAQSEKLFHLTATLNLDMAEAALVAGNARQAQNALRDTQRIFGRRDMAQGAIGIHKKYLSAIAEYQAGNVVAGDTLLEEAIQMKTAGASKWLLHMQIADDRITKGRITDIKALRLYETILRGPASADWMIDPLDTLTVLRTPHDGVFENWFELAISREDTDMALWIADLARRHRFFQQLPLGGRLLGLRWLLDGPADQLSNEQTLMRRDLLTLYPRYAALAEQATAVQKQLRGIPWAVGDAAQRKIQVGLLQQLDTLSQEKELLLRQMAARREVSTLSFPPIRSTIEVRQELQDGQMALIFFNTSRGMHVFQIGRAGGREIYGRWRLPQLNNALRHTKTLLRDLGNFGPNRAMRGEDLVSTDWREAGKELRELIFGVRTIPDGIKELIVVPDGMFWYVPFETLQLPTAGGGNESMISRMQIRYAPMMALMLPEGDRKTPLPNTAIAVGKMTLPEPPELITEAVQAMAQEIPGAASIPKELPASSSIYGTLFDRLVILDEIQGSASTPFGWSPLAAEKGGRTAITLADWFPLPLDAPREIIMPGYHTMAEDGLKTQNAATTGNEMFLSVMGMMSCGTRTILLSRWRVGGETCYDMMREFVRELDSMTAAEAWQRSVFLSLQLPIDPAKEPRVNINNKAQQVNASHPFFWSGYMLFDSGLSPLVPEVPPVDPNAVDVDDANKDGAGGIQAGGFGGGDGG